MRSALDDFVYLPGHNSEYVAAVEQMLDDLIAGRPILPKRGNEPGPEPFSDHGPQGGETPPYDDGYWRQ